MKFVTNSQDHLKKTVISLLEVHKKLTINSQELLKKSLRIPPQKFYN